MHGDPGLIGPTAGGKACTRHRCEMSVRAIDGVGGKIKGSLVGDIKVIAARIGSHSPGPPVRPHWSLSVKAQLTALRIDNVSRHCAMLRLGDVNESRRGEVSRDHGHVDLSFSDSSAVIPRLHNRVV